MRWLIVLAPLLVACSGRTAPTEHSDNGPPPPPPPPPPTERASAVAPPDPPAAASTASPEREEVPGRGTCQTDDDCVLSRYQPGCCVQACQDYATNKRDLAARKAQENCAGRRGEQCPPPAPCRPPTHRVIAAKCSAGACVAVREPIGR